MITKVKDLVKRIGKAWRVLRNKQMCENCEECSCNS